MSAKGFVPYSPGVRRKQKKFSQNNKMNKNFNIIIVGVGGQGLITLVSIIDQAAFIESKQVRSSELHGLSQREGSVETHIRFGEKIYSPLVYNGQADLIIGLEMVESLRASNRAGSKTRFLINEYFSPFIGGMSTEAVKKGLDVLGKNLNLIPAQEICKKELQNEVVSSIYLLGYGIAKGIIPLKAESVLKAIEAVVPEKYQALNKKAFLLS